MQPAKEAAFRRTVPVLPSLLVPWHCFALVPGIKQLLSVSELNQNCFWKDKTPCPDSHHSNASAWAGRGRREKQAVRPEPFLFITACVKGRLMSSPGCRLGRTKMIAPGHNIHCFLKAKHKLRLSNNWVILQLRFKKKKSVRLHHYRHLFCTVTILALKCTL